MATAPRILLFSILIHCAISANAQNFGTSLDFLIKETNARTAALGGFNVSLRDEIGRAHV
jgi:hypothetical protein